MRRDALIGGWLVTILIPFVLLMVSIRILITPVFPYIEYHMPNFPADIYGFTQEDRIHWSKYAVNYLLNQEDISYLGNLRFPDGTPLFIESELSHMEDVKRVVQGMITALFILIIILIAIMLWAWYKRWMNHYIYSLARGGFITILLILGLLIGVGIGFSRLFAGFHQLFFAEGTWVFQYSDTLIRLFPMRFWQDAFLGTGVLTVIFSIGLILINKAFSKRLSGG